MKKFWFILFIVWTLFIILVSVIPFSSEIGESEGSDFRWDYLEHFLAYFAFASLYILWRSNRNFRIRNIELLLMFALMVSFSILTEYLQLLVPGRTFNFVDAAYNLGGLVSSFLIVYLILIRTYMRRKLTPVEV